MAFGVSQGWKPYDKRPNIHDTQSGALEYGKRQNILDIVELAKNNLIQRVIVNDIDRAGRDSVVLRTFVDALYAAGARPIVALDSREFPTAMEFMQNYHFHISVAEYNRYKIIIGTTQGMITAFKSGAFLTTPPFGYKRTRNQETNSGIKTSVTTLEPDPEAVELVIKGLELFAETQSYRQAAIKLNFYNNNKQGTKKHSFISSVITRMVKNLDLYLGLPYSKTREFITGQPITQQFQHTAIISQDLANRVRLADTLRNRETTNAIVPKPFRRLIYCSHCETLAKISTKNPGNTQRANIYHYANCFTKEKNHNLVRSGIGHTLKNTTCGCEITVGKFLKHLATFLETLDNNLFESQLQELIAQRIFNLKKMSQFIDTYEYSLAKTERECKENENLLLIALARGKESTIETVEARAEELANKIQKLRQQIMDRKETYSKELTNLSIFGLDTELIKSLSATLDVEDYRNLNEVSQLESSFDAYFEQIGVIQRRHSRMFLVQLEPHLTKVTELIQILRTALKEQDWILLNTTMAQLGLRFTADFSEPGRIKRTQSIQLQIYGLISPLKSGRVSPP